MKTHRTAIMLSALLTLAAASRDTFAAPLCLSRPGKACHDDGTSHGGAVQLVPRPSVQASCSIPGTWMTTYGEMNISSQLTGTFVASYCPAPFAVTVTPQGAAAFSVRAIWSGDPVVCVSFTESMAFSSADCNTATGTYVNDGSSGGFDTWSRTSCPLSVDAQDCQPQITLTRRDLLAVGATGTPAGGSFSYQSRAVSGASVATIKYATGVSAQANPNTATLAAPANPDPLGRPSPGGLMEATATYSTSADASASKTLHVPTFGISCYYTASELDWGTPPNACSTLTIKGKKYTGAVNNPLGLAGNYCRAFIAQVELQGSGVTAAGQKVQYNRTANRIAVVANIVGSDQTPVIAGQTIARDPKIIPGHGVRVDIDRVGSGLLANDTGGDIKNYRIDVFAGAGAAVCASYRNIISVSACNPGSSKCPANDIE